VLSWCDIVWGLKKFVKHKAEAKFMTLPYYYTEIFTELFTSDHVLSCKNASTKLNIAETIQIEKD
jgi:hypothetical protein